jgi:hypothetical protein
MRGDDLQQLLRVLQAVETDRYLDSDESTALQKKDHPFRGSPGMVPYRFNYRPAYCGGLLCFLAQGLDGTKLRGFIPATTVAGWEGAHSAVPDPEGILAGVLRNAFPIH